MTLVFMFCESLPGIEPIPRSLHNTKFYNKYLRGVKAKARPEVGQHEKLPPAAAYCHFNKISFLLLVIRCSLTDPTLERLNFGIS